MNMERSIRIGSREVGDTHPVFIVAEIGINHNGSVEQAKRLISAAQEAGVDAVKFQVFRADEFVGDPGLTYTYRSQGREITEPMLEMFQRYEFDSDEWREIFRFSRDAGVGFFATPQNPSDLDFILSITDMPAIKVGSDDLTNLELLDSYARRGKPLIISAGMAYLSEIDEAVNTIRAAGNPDLVVLHCISSYPAGTEEINLRKIPAIRRIFNVPVGFSDHTLGSRAALGAVALGACMIEKHITLDRDLPGPDHWFSADPEEIRELVAGIRFMEEALGSSLLEPTEKERGMRELARRSIVASRDIDEGETIGRDMLALRRPGTGLAPKFLAEVLHRRAARPIRRHEPISFDAIR
jgi:N-acetylneuraminate synthase/N,N'-diacetyllegionaminate synthase